MSNSSSHDDNRLQEIEQVLHSGQSGADPLVNHLAGTQPRPDSTFADALEAQLLAQLQDSNTAPSDSHTPPDTKKEHLMRIKKKQNSTPYAVPLTMLAAVLAIVIAGGLLLFANLPTPPGTPLAGGVLLPEQQEESDAILATVTAAPDINATAVVPLMTATPGSLPSETELEATRQMQLSNAIPTEACPVDAGNVVYHTIYQTDTWFRLANQFDIPLDDLLALNCVERPYTLGIGDKVILPADVIVNPVNMQTVVIAAQDIPMGTIVTDDMVYEVTVTDAVHEQMLNQILNQMSDDDTPASLISRVEDVIGEQTKEFTSRYQPFQQATIDTRLSCALGLEECIMVPEGYIALMFPVDNPNRLDDFQRGQRVDIVANVSYLESEEFQNTLNDGEYYQAGPDAMDLVHVPINAIMLNADKENGVMTLAIAILPENYRTLPRTFAELGVPMQPVPHLPERNN